MSNCCTTSPKAKKQDCPACTSTSKPVSYETVLHHVKYPACLDIEQMGFNFCEDKSCDTVYFHKDKTQFKLHEVREVVGQKTERHDRPICYCFDIKASDIISEIEESGVSKSKQKVIQLTKKDLCDCSIRNPAGSCCLVEFKEIENQLKKYQV